MKKFLASLFLLLSYSTAFAVDFPEPTGYVTDIYSVMTDTQKTDFEQDLQAYEEQTGTEIAYLIIGTTEGMEIADYAVAVGNEWGVGKESADNGILVVTAIDDREFWIATGSQTEGYLTDSSAGNIFRNTVKPYFQDGKYYEGLVASFDDIKSALNGETIGTISDTTTAESESGFGILVMLFAGLGVIIWLGSVLGRSKAIWPGAAIGGGGGFIISVFSGFGFVEIIFAILFFGFMGLVFDTIVSAEYKNAGKSGRSPKWWSGGSGWGGGSSGGSSGGGFGGFGGGGFSGGGGGGSW
jgi:uncharacterized protein